jgi:hypothetical protein
MARNPPRTNGDKIEVPPSNSNHGHATKHITSIKDPMFWVTLATLIVVSVYTLFACKQVQETQTANSIAKKALTEANKPYVMFTSLVPNYTMDNAGRHFRIGIQWTNLGNTPATFVRAFNCDPIIREDIVEPEFHCKISENKEQTPASVLGPKQPLSVIGSIIKESDFDDTRTEKKAIYVFGYVTYQDAIDVDDFGNPEQRETRFCNRIAEPTTTVYTPPPNTAANPSPTAQNAPATSAPNYMVVNPPPGAPIIAVAGLGCKAFACMDKECRPLD